MLFLAEAIIIPLLYMMQLENGENTFFQLNYNKKNWIYNTNILRLFFGLAVEDFE
jgi:hypothetical protein